METNAGTAWNPSALFVIRRPAPNGRSQFYHRTQDVEGWFYTAASVYYHVETKAIMERFPEAERVQVC